MDGGNHGKADWLMFTWDMILISAKMLSKVSIWSASLASKLPTGSNGAKIRCKDMAHATDICPKK